jgi:cyclase
MSKTIILSILVLFLSFSGTAQDKGSKDQKDDSNYQNKPSVIDVTDNIFMLKGLGGNIAVQKGIDGVLMIDTQFEKVSEFIQDIIERKTEQKVEFIINTHLHGDHVGGNKSFTRDGATVIAHKNVRSSLREELIQIETSAFRKKLEEEVAKAKQRNGNSGKTEQLQETMEKRWEEKMSTVEIDHEALPAISFENDLLFHYNDEDIQLIYLPNAHTNSDVIVYFPKSNVLHTGDAFVHGLYPYIDTKNGGSYNGYVNGLKQIERLVNLETKIIPGHGELASLKDVQELSKILENYYSRIKAAFLQDKTEDEVAAMRNFTSFYDGKGYGDGFITTESFLRAVYKEVVRNESAYKRKNEQRQKLYEESLKKDGN